MTTTPHSRHGRVRYKDCPQCQALSAKAAESSKDRLATLDVAPEREPDMIVQVAGEPPQIVDIKVAKRLKARKATLPVTPGAEYVPGEAVVETISREDWLNRAVEALRPDFEAIDFPIPAKVRVSVGWPGGRGKKKGVIGQCWPQSLAADGIHALFISPVVTEPVKVLGVLVHELVHASVPKGEHHRGAFVKAAKALGLTPPWTGTDEGPELRERLTALAETLGTYDHAGLTSLGRQQVQSTRMLKVECPEDGYIVRTTRKWLDVGLPLCPDGHTMEEV